MPYMKALGLAGFHSPLGFVGMWTKAPNAYVAAHQCWDVRAARRHAPEEVLR